MSEPRTKAGREFLGSLQNMTNTTGHGFSEPTYRRAILAIEDEASQPRDLTWLIEKARDWRYSDEWIGMTFRARVRDAHGESDA